MSGLMDVAQAASNAVASNVYGPVDLLAAALRKAGVPVPEDPFLGSEWLRKRGLIRDVPQGVEQVVGETLGLLAPAMLASKASQIASGLLKARENAAAPTTLRPDAGAIVWHGSPHKFDRFDSSKIGTGEGAQAYGHGLYLAESPGVARQYAENVKDMGAVQRINAELSQLSKIMASDEIPGAYRKYRTDAGREAAKRYDELMASRESVRQAPGQMYKVDLPDDKIARMLDWDKPLSQQPIGSRMSVVKNQSPAFSDEKWLVNIGDTTVNAYKTKREAAAALESATGQDLWKALNASGARVGADGLRQQGIPGIRYLDGGSRGVGSGTSNFVVFPGEEGLLTILERNGAPLGR